MVKRLSPSKQQIKILKLVAVGKSNGEIGRKLGISVKTVERHRADLYSRIGVRCAVRATHWALARKLVKVVKN